MMDDSQNKPSKRRAVIIGAGPVGCLTAISFAKTLGWDVELYEARQGLFSLTSADFVGFSPSDWSSNLFC